MIHYPIRIRDLFTKIHQVSPSWLHRARKRAQQFAVAGEYFENKTDAVPFWNELKPVYMDIQGGKCLYCERSFGDADSKTIDLDVEHYRQKGKVDSWPSPGMRAKHRHLRHYTRPRGVAVPEGYWSLAYHPLNLALCCLRCNRTFKRTYFPINGQRVLPTAGKRHLRQFNSEQPDLFYPLADLDSDNPEECIAFKGPFAFPADNLPIRVRERVRVTIDLLHLNQRPELIRGRCRVIQSMFPSYLLAQEKDLFKRNIGELSLYGSLQRTAPHYRCAICYLELCQQNREVAYMFFLEAVARLEYLPKR